MAWVYSQALGVLNDASGALSGTGYSGHGIGLNNPDYQNVPDVGPIPQGSYAIDAPIDSPTHGPYVLPLTPLNGTETFGRSGFLIHGDEVQHVGEHLASLGCIIMPRSVRELIWASSDHTLEVIG